MTFHPSGLRECPTRRPSVRKREKVRTKVICFTLLSVFFIFYFLCRRGSRQRRGDTEEEDLMCVCQTICQIQLFFFLSVSHRSTLPSPPPVLVQKAVIQSRDPSVEEITPTWVVWGQNSCFVLGLSHIVYTVIYQEFLPNEIMWLWSVPGLICAKNMVFKIRTCGSNSAAIALFVLILYFVKHFDRKHPMNKFNTYRCY